MITSLSDTIDQDSALRVRRVRGCADWEECRASRAGATPFHRWDWLHIMAEALGSRFLPLGFYHGTELVGLTPLLVKQYGPYKNVNWAPFPYLGPLVPVPLLPQALRALMGYQRRNGIGLIQLGFAPGAASDAALLTAQGYDVRTDTTLVLPLAGRGEEEIWKGMRSSGQRNVKRARKAGLTVRSATEHEMTRDLPAIMSGVFARRGQPPPYPARTATLIWQRYHDDGDVRMAAAHSEGQLAALSITLIDGERAYMWDGGSRDQYRDSSPDALLYWDSICWARERGCVAIDMVGSPEKGVGDYKKSFGAVEAPYLVANRINSRPVAWGRRAANRATLLAYALAQRAAAARR